MSQDQLFCKLRCTRWMLPQNYSKWNSTLKSCSFSVPAPETKWKFKIVLLSLLHINMGLRGVNVELWLSVQLLWPKWRKRKLIILKRDFVSYSSVNICIGNCSGSGGGGEITVFWVIQHVSFRRMQKAPEFNSDINQILISKLRYTMGGERVGFKKKS